MRGRVSTVLAVLLVGAAAAAAPGASAAGTVQFTSVTYDVTPKQVFADVREPVRLIFRADTTYSGNTPPFAGKLNRLVYDLDPSFLISPQGFPQCDPATIAGTTTEDALLACGAAQIGGGGANRDGTFPESSGDVVVFNGTPGVDSVPRFLVHVRFPASTSTTVMVGAITSSPPGEGFGGQRLDLTVPILGGGRVFTSLDFSFGRFEGPQGFYTTGRCPGRWAFAYSAFHDNGAFSGGESNVPCTVTTRTPPSPPSNTVVVGPQSGSTQNNSELTLTVPGPGTVALVGSPVPVSGKAQAGHLAASAAKGKKKKPKPQVLIAPTQVTATAAGQIALPLTLTRAGLQLLVKKGKVVSPVSITFTPTGGTASTTPATVTISGPKPKKKPKKK